MGKEERQYWNIVKGVAVFLVIWGHCIQYCAMDTFDFFEDKVFTVIYTFHMPVFMLVSGYLFFYSFQRRELKDLIIHRTQAMLQPIVFGTILYNGLMVLPDYLLKGRINILDGALLVGFEYYLWFLWAVLIASIAVAVVCKSVKKLILQIVLLMAGVGFVLLFPSRDTNLYMYPFFIIGFYCAAYRQRVVKVYHKCKYVIMLLYLAMIPFYEKKHFIYLTSAYTADSGWIEILSIWVFRFIIGLAGSISLLTVVELWLRAAEGKKAFRRVRSGLRCMGENSLQIYCLSLPLLSGYLPHVYKKIMEPFGCNLFAESMMVYDWIFTPILSALYCAGLCMIVQLMRKCGVHKLFFGR